jgi:NADH-quinone oxidoreductase subunit E
MTAELQLTGHRDQLFSESIRQQLDSWISKYPPGQAQSAVIPALHILQDACVGGISGYSGYQCV